MSRYRIFAAIPFALAMAASQTMGAVVSLDEVSDDPLFFDGSITGSLITTGQSSLTSVTGTASNTPFVLGGVNNGSAVGYSLQTTDSNTLTFYNNLSTTPATITFKLSQAYDITSIRSLTGWGDTYFGSQIFTISLETNNSGTYNLLGEFGETPYTAPAPAGFPTVADNGFSVRTTITNNSSAFIAGNVTGVRFLFTDPYPTISTLNGTVIRELSVYGTVSVPEPGTCLLAAFGGLAVFSRRRRA